MALAFALQSETLVVCIERAINTLNVRAMLAQLGTCSWASSTCRYQSVPQRESPLYLVCLTVAPWLCGVAIYVCYGVEKLDIPGAHDGVTERCSGGVGGTAGIVGWVYVTLTRVSAPACAVYRA